MNEPIYSDYMMRNAEYLGDRADEYDLAAYNEALLIAWRNWPPETEIEAQLMADGVFEGGLWAQKAAKLRAMAKSLR